MKDTRAAIDAVANGLLPPIRRADNDTRWTMEERLAHHRVPGCGCAVIEGGEIAWAEGFGVTEKGGSKKVEADTVFMGASTSKPVTGTLVMQLVERGVFDLDAPINSYLKRWQLPDNEFTRGNPVTLRRALSHTAGLTVNGWAMWFLGRPVPSIYNLLDATPHTDLAPWPNEFPMPAVRVNKVQGESVRYSGAGFLLAQIAIEDQLGKTFDTLADEMIFQPLGMTRTTFTQPMPQHLRPLIAAGHHIDGEPVPGGWMVSAEMAAGGIITTAPDYARFMIGCRAAWLGEKGAILGQDFARQMMTRQSKGAFGIGWRVLGEGHDRWFNHGGSNDGYQNEANCYLESGKGGCVFTNGVGGLFLFREVLNAMADVYRWPGFMPEPKRVVALSPEEQQKYVGEYKIVSGIEMPLMRIWVEDGVLKNQIPGLRVGVRDMLLDDTGKFFSQSGPFETVVNYGPDGRAMELIAYEAGTMETLRAQRIA